MVASTIIAALWGSLEDIRKRYGVGLLTADEAATAVAMAGVVALDNLADLRKVAQ